MNYKILKSLKSNYKEAVLEATNGIKSPKMVLFFSSAEHFQEYTVELKKIFETSIVIGSTSFAEFCNDGAYKSGLVVIGFEDGIECYADVLEDVDKYPIKYTKRISNCVNKIKDYSNTVCFEICSALVSCEEFVLSTLNAVLDEKKIPLFGGSSGDEGKAENTMISFNGIVYNKACVFVIIKNMGGKIKLYRENIYKPTDNYFTATKVDLRKRIVYEYDNKPAAEVIAKALNTTIEKLPKYLDNHPIGRIVGDDMYITANKAVCENKGIEYHARVYKNENMVLLEPSDYKETINNTINQIKKDIPKPSLSIMVNCLARSMLFESDGYLNEFAKEMATALGNYIGFSGYGEQLNKQHFNQTMVIAVFE